MKRLIFLYLSRTFIVEGNKIHQLDKPRNSFGVNKLNVVHKLIKVFGLPESEFKWYVKGWIKQQNKGFDFNKFWGKGNVVYYTVGNGDSLVHLPFIVSATTPRLMSMDLVEVRPMNPPRINNGIYSMSVRYQPEVSLEYINIRGNITDTTRFEQEVEKATEHYRGAVMGELNTSYGTKIHTPSMTFARPSGGW